MSSSTQLMEFIAKERRQLIWECLEGLYRIRQQKGLNPTSFAAMEALERLYMRSIRNKLAMVTHEEMARPVAIAQAAMERHGVTCAHW